jgi:hypothetical protein
LRAAEGFFTRARLFTRPRLDEPLFNFFTAGRLGPLLALAGFGTRFEETGFFAIGVLTSRFQCRSSNTRGGCHTGRDGTVSGLDFISHKSQKTYIQSIRSSRGGALNHVASKEPVSSERQFQANKLEIRLYRRF